MSKRTPRILEDTREDDAKEPDAKKPAKGADLLRRSQAERMTLEYEGRPRDSGAMLEALKREHRERDPNPEPLLGKADPS